VKHIGASRSPSCLQRLQFVSSVMMEDPGMTKPHFHFSACLRVMDAPELHDAIESRTGLKATESHKKGDLANRKTGRRWKNDIWTIESRSRQNSNLSSLLRSLWHRIEPHHRYFAELAKKGTKIDVFCGYSSDYNGAGFSIDPDALKIVTALKVKLEVSCILL